MLTKAIISEYCVRTDIFKDNISWRLTLTKERVEVTQYGQQVGYIICSTGGWKEEIKNLLMH